MVSISKKTIGYSFFFLTLFIGFYLFLANYSNFTQAKLLVINNDVKDFSFINQNGKTIDQRTVDGKVYVVEYFFTTCRGICPKMNANMRLVYNKYKNESDFLILSHSCMPETDSTPLLKKYEQWMINGTLKKMNDGSYLIEHPDSSSVVTTNINWHFLTGKADELYKMARASYLIDNNKKGQVSNVGTEDFLHTQFFALVDKQRRVRKIYDGLKMNEVEELLLDIKELLKETTTSRQL